MSGALLQSLGSLVLLIGLLLAGAWLFRRSGGVQALQRGPVRIVGGVRVGTREKVLLLEVADSWVLVGVAAGQVNALHTLPRQTLNDPAGSTPPAGFAQMLNRLAGRQDGGDRA